MNLLRIRPEKTKKPRAVLYPKIIGPNENLIDQVLINEKRSEIQRVIISQNKSSQLAI